jgi:hypothetical protein
MHYMNYKSLFYGMPHLSDEVKVMVEKAVGPHHAARMYDSRGLAESYLAHVEPAFRWAAIHVLAVHWGPDEAFTSACERLLCDDRDIGVRSCSMTYICMCCCHTDEARIGRVVAKLVYDNAEPYQLRMAAYESLFHLRRSHGYTTLRPTRVSNFRFPEDVDWTFVDGFLYSAAKVGQLKLPWTQLASGTQ